MQVITPCFSHIPKEKYAGSRVPMDPKMTLHYNRGVPPHCGSPCLSYLLGKRIGCLMSGSQDLRYQLFLGIV